MNLDLVSAFQSFRTVLCICPECKEIHRLSDLKIEYAGKVPTTWLDQLGTKNANLDEKEEIFEEKENDLRKAAAERGRKKVWSLIQKSMNPKLAKLGFNPYDIKTIMHPVDYVLFDGMNDEELREVTFLSTATTCPSLVAARHQLRQVIKEQKYEWQVARVGIDGKISYE